jgi:peptidoglycan hydrolase-like protein with peptidoglycan-binding domain
MPLVAPLRRLIRFAVPAVLACSALAVVPTSTASTAEAACTINSTLRVGSRNAQVSCLEQTLRARGLQSTWIDNYYGTATRATIIRFQRANRLYVDGVVGPQTGRALGIWGATATAPPSSPAPVPPLTPAPEGSCASVRMVGDSMGVGMVNTLNSALGARGIGFRSKTVVGTGTPAMSEFVGQLRSSYGDAPCWVVVSGSNDMWFTARSTTAGPERVAQMIAAINANGVSHRIFWVNTLSWNSTTGMARINAAIAASGAQVIDWHGTARDNRSWFVDHVHTGVTGNAARANMVIAAVTR